MASPTTHAIIGTAGHIDHGKTALIKALTGQDTDRLKEEKERGISIDLGFAYFTLPDGTRTGIVDVPGHERFIRNMLAGAHGIDLVLFAVAADDGVMPQTEEHLDILHLLGARRGIFVITKADLVDAARIGDVRDEIELLADDVIDPAEAVPAVRAVQAAFRGYLDALTEWGGATVRIEELPDEPALLSFIVGAAMVIDLPDRQALLDESGTLRRLSLQRALLSRETAMLRSTTSRPAPDLRNTPYNPN